MKRSRIIFLIFAAFLVLGACSPESESAEEEKSNNEQEKPEAEQPGNKENVEAVAKALSDKNVRYKTWIDDENNMSVVLTDVGYFSGNEDDNSYGFDDPKTGTSVYAYAHQNDLNEEQENAIWSLVNPTEEDVDKIMEDYPEGFSEKGYPYQGADFDYTTVSNVEAESAEEGAEITAEIDVHFHLKDGTEEVETVETSTVPDIGDTELDEDKVDDALNADVMNEDIPTEDRFVYVDDD